ncbi:MAG: sigma 54-interacting transcriptional regulator [Bacteroidia bacterium]|jgi:DNA-binding NtrC family response regulator|nr:sigma 54-interacting transcriptional regulator [Bacteroidia bacterium]GIV23519.1 MAG: sigma-54-dependent Fis family transcriptional regulator [Bacteroidia bacterium]
MLRTSTPSAREVARRFRLIGEDPHLLAAVELAIRVAPTDVPVLILGENGTGKEAFAHILHNLSRRKDKPFLAINCGAIPEGTMDSELFGHEKGAFTSAYESRKGYFEVANGGTLFLDEIGEMPLGTQARLLRVLETGEFLRVGSSKVQHTDVRLVAATNRDLIQLIQQGKFREDLYHRLNAITIHVPPLRERGRDIELLFDFFADEFAHTYGVPPVQLTPAGAEALLEYPWPGNVRELKHFVEKLTILHAGEEIDDLLVQRYLPPRETRLPVPYLPTATHTPPPPPSTNGEGWTYPQLLQALQQLQAGQQALQEMLRQIWNHLAQQDKPRLPASTLSTPTSPEEEDFSLENQERRLIEKALRHFAGNRKKAAQALGISERTLYRKIEEYGLHHL